MESSCSPSGDNKFGPAVAECLRSFDFTLLFEESILSILPCTLLLLLFLVRLFYLSRRRVRVVTGKVLQNLKVVSKTAAEGALPYAFCLYGSNQPSRDLLSFTLL